MTEIRTAVAIITRTIATYNAVAPDYAAAWHDRSVLAAQFARFVELVRPGGWVLDVGCGPGFDTAVLRQHGLRAVGIDLSQNMLAVGQKYHHLTGCFVQADMRFLPFRANIDGIWACASFLHIPRPQALPTMRQFARLLAPGGVIYLSVKEGKRSRWTQKTYGHSLPRYYTYWQAESLDDLLQTAGLLPIEGWLETIGRTRWLVRFAQKQA
ncbi:MAG: class I SAM-dependent methyltransferase [Chloroflexi bacterium]|nr:MAG: class I SAM-dependent methyltransferase [Chloroflexota bacterium]